MELNRIVVEIGFSLYTVEKLEGNKIFLLTFKPSVKMARKS